jgi:hypothetical protein
MEQKDAAFGTAVGQGRLRAFRGVVSNLQGNRLPVGEFEQGGYNAHPSWHIGPTGQARAPAHAYTAAERDRRAALG